MKISEMEGYHDAFTEIEQKIQIMLAQREFPEVFSVCVESFPSIVPSIQYRRKRNIEPEVPHLLAFDVICKYAPALFEHVALTAVLAFVKSTRQLVKHENAYLPRIESALEEEEIARLMWNQLEKHRYATQKEICLGIDASLATMVTILRLWEEFGVVIRPDKEDVHKLTFTTLLHTEMEGICPNCGVRGKGLKLAFFKPLSCQKCGVHGYYHILYRNHL